MKNPRRKRGVTRETAKAKRAAQAAGVKYGCHVDLEEGMRPDGCVLDSGDTSGCVYAYRHRTREGCPHWHKIATA